jgi:hypothetical protein
MQLLANYTIYYTAAIFWHKSLIYIGISRAWISVNPSHLNVFGATGRGEHFDDSKPGVHKAYPKPLEIRPTCLEK